MASKRNNSGGGFRSLGSFFSRNGSNKSSSEHVEQVNGEPKWRMGILNDKHSTDVPGSVMLMATGSDAASRDGTETKKRTADGTIILEPQPEDSPNDPLNWPSWQRDIALLALGIYCMLGGGGSPLIAAGFTDVADTYHVETEEVALTTGLFMMGLGIGSVISSPTAILYGKRPVYLASAVMAIATSLWAGFSPSFNSLLFARIFQGIALSAVECLPSVTIAEIFFLHERAFRIGIYALLMLGGKNLIPLVSAIIIGQLGWRWVFFILAICISVSGVAMFMFLPETFWDRMPVLEATRSSGEDTPEINLPKEPAVAARTMSASRCETGDRGSLNTSRTVTMLNHPADKTQSDSESDTSYFKGAPNVDNEKIPASQLALVEPYTETLRGQPAKKFTQRIKPFHGRLRNDNWFKVMIRPFILFAYPAVLWSSVVYACSIGWLIVVSESMAMIYRNPHSYNFTALQTGLVYISPFVGGILGSAVAGECSDLIARAMSRRNGGLYEPEFRLVMAGPVLITTCIGLMGFGWAAEEKDHYMVPTTFFGIISFGCSLGSTTAITFCVDSYRQYAGEALVTLNFSKNILHGLVFSLFVTHWLTDDGPKQVYIFIGVIQLILLLFTIPMYIYGKRARMWTVRKNFMAKF